MVIARRAGCTILGESTDTKPDHPGLAGFVFEETNTGNLWYHSGTGWTLLQGATKTEILENKTIDPAENTFINLITSPLITNSKRIGHMVPVSSNPADTVIGGALAGWPSAGTADFIYGTTVGRYANTFTSSTLDSYIGYLSDIQSVGRIITRREFNPYFKVKCRPSDITTSMRLLMGYTTETPPSLSDIFLGTNRPGVLIGFRTTDLNYMVFHNDDTATMNAIDTGVTIDPASTTHEFEISMLADNTVKCVIDDGAGAKTQILTTKLPALTTDLYLHCVGELATSASRWLRIFGGTFRSDK